MGEGWGSGAKPNCQISLSAYQQVEGEAEAMVFLLELTLAQTRPIPHNQGKATPHPLLRAKAGSEFESPPD